MKVTKSINCGDWHLGWGLSGNNKIGKLRIVEDFDINDVENAVFGWKGYSQGRHGQKGNKGAFCTFILKNDNVQLIEFKGGLPRSSELIKGAKELLLNINK